MLKAKGEKYVIYTHLFEIIKKIFFFLMNSFICFIVWINLIFVDDWMSWKEREIGGFGQSNGIHIVTFLLFSCVWETVEFNTNEFLDESYHIVNLTFCFGKCDFSIQLVPMCIQTHPYRLKLVKFLCM